MVPAAGSEPCRADMPMPFRKSIISVKILERDGVGVIEIIIRYCNARNFTGSRVEWIRQK